MHISQHVRDNIYWVGASDRRLAMFENMFPLPGGVSYNSYLIMDDKVALVDSVDSAILQVFLENIAHVLNGRSIDYLVINHMEPDHCDSIDILCSRFPDMKIVGNAKTFQIIRQFYNFDIEGRCHEVKENDTLCLGAHTLKFIFAPMVHWPEVMMTHDMTSKVLFSADAFGTFGALHGNLFADELDFDGFYMDEARRYYTNIVGRYGQQVQQALAKVSGLDIDMICPLHGPVWRKNLQYFIGKYDRWSRYEPEKSGVVIAYASMYGNTENAAAVIAGRLSERGVNDLRMYDVSKTHPSYITADAFKYSHLVFASPTYNNGLYFNMHSLLHDMAVLNLRGRKVALVGNGSWAPVAHKVMEEMIGKMKDMTLVAPPLVLRSALKPSQMDEAMALADAVADSVLARIKEMNE